MLVFLNIFFLNYGHKLHTISREKEREGGGGGVGGGGGKGNS